MTGDVHEIQIGAADELNLGRVEESVVVFADEARVLDCLLRELAYVRLGADYSDIIGMRFGALVCQGDVLAYQHTDADAGHVESIEKGLDVGVDLHALALALVFENTLGCR